MALCCIYQLSIVSTITVTAGCVAGGSLACAPGTCTSSAPGRARSQGTLLPWQEPGEGQGEEATEAGAESGPAPCPRRGPGLLCPSQPWPPMLQAEPTGMLPAQPCPHAPLQRCQPTLPTARHPTSSMGRGTPFAYTPPGTNPLELAPNHFPCAASFCDGFPSSLIAGEEEAWVAQCASAPPQPKATCQHVSEILSPKCLSPSASRTKGPGGDGLVLCVSAGWV